MDRAEEWIQTKLLVAWRAVTTRTPASSCNTTVLLEPTVLIASPIYLATCLSGDRDRNAKIFDFDRHGHIEYRDSQLPLRLSPPNLESLAVQKPSTSRRQVKGGLFSVAFSDSSRRPLPGPGVQSQLQLRVASPLLTLQKWINFLYDSPGTLGQVAQALQRTCSLHCH